MVYTRESTSFSPKDKIDFQDTNYTSPQEVKSFWRTGDVTHTSSLIKKRQGTLLEKSILTIGSNQEAAKTSLNDSRVQANSNTKLNVILEKIDVQYDKAIGKVTNWISNNLDKFKSKKVTRVVDSTLIFNHTTKSYIVKDDPNDLDDPGRMIVETNKELKGEVIIEKTTKNKDSTITVSNKIYAKAQLIGEGLSAYIFAIGSGTKELILKLEKVEQSSLTDGSVIKSSLLKGDALLNRLLGSKKKVVGLVEKNKKVIQVTDAQGQKLTGVLQKRYNGDVENDKIHKLPIEKKLAMFSDLAKGVRYLQRKNFHHGDIKPKNILYEVKESSETNNKEKNGLEYKAVIADLDDGIFMDNKEQQYTPSCTRGYVYSKDMEQKNNIASQISNGLKLGKEAKSFLNAVDIYALGASYKYMLFSKAPENDEMHTMDHTGLSGTSEITKDQAEANGIPEDVMNFVNRMLDEDWSKRPAMREVDHFFREYASN